MLANSMHRTRDLATADEQRAASARSLRRRKSTSSLIRAVSAREGVDYLRRDELWDVGASVLALQIEIGFSQTECYSAPYLREREWAHTAFDGGGYYQLRRKGATDEDPRVEFGICVGHLQDLRDGGQAFCTAAGWMMWDGLVEYARDHLGLES